jgi:hypothetical protein
LTFFDSHVKNIDQPESNESRQVVLKELASDEQAIWLYPDCDPT